MVDALCAVIYGVLVCQYVPIHKWLFLPNAEIGENSHLWMGTS
jgi:hypothetical protein